MAEEQQVPGSFCWVELMTRDVETAKKFYAELIGWTMRDQDIANRPYTVFTPPGHKKGAGGMMALDGPQFEGVPPHWMPYILVTDIDAKAEKCVALGGKLHHPPTDIPNVGRFCVIEDPTGAAVSLFQEP